MPASDIQGESDTPKGRRRSGRLLTAMFWLAMGLVPPAALLLLVGHGTGLRAAAVLALLVIVLIGLSIGLRRDPEAVRQELEETFLDEIDLIRDDARADIATAAQATHRAFGKKLQALYEDLNAMQGRLAAMGVPGSGDHREPHPGEEPAGTWGRQGPQWSDQPRRDAAPAAWSAAPAAAEPAPGAWSAAPAAPERAPASPAERLRRPHGVAWDGQSPAAPQHPALPQQSAGGEQPARPRQPAPGQRPALGPALGHRPLSGQRPPFGQQPPLGRQPAWGDRGGNWPPSPRYAGRRRRAEPGPDDYGSHDYQPR